MVGLVAHYPFKKIQEAWQEGASRDQHLNVVALEYDAFENCVAKTSASGTTVYFGRSYERRSVNGGVDNVYMIESPTGPVAQLRIPDGAGPPRSNICGRIISGRSTL